MFVYGVSSGTALTSSGTPNTEVEDWFVKAGTGRSVGIQQILPHGKGAAVAAISGLSLRLKKWTTASTAGTAVTPQPADPGAQAAKHTTAVSPTAGSGGGLYHLEIGCGAGSPGGWAAPNQDSLKVLESAFAGSFDVVSAAGTASMVHAVALETVE